MLVSNAITVILSDSLTLAAQPNRSASPFPFHQRWEYVMSLKTKCCVFRFQEGYDDPHKPLPSPVVHIRGLVDGIMEADLVEALQEFGAVR